MSYAFDKDAQDGDEVTLANGATYKYDKAKDRWLVKAVAGGKGGADWGFPLPEEQGNYVSKTGDEMSGDLEMVKNADGVDTKIHTRWIDSSENSNLHLQHNGNTRIYVGRDEVAITKPLKLGIQGVEDDHAVSKLYVDNADRHLQTKIDELEAEIDVIAPRLEAAQYTYVGSPVVKTGEMHIASGTFTSGTDIVFFNDTALDGKQHTWAALDVGDYLEVTDTLEVENRTAEDYAMYLVTKAPEGSGMKQIEVALVKGHGVPHVGDMMDAKAFQLGGNDINDLDARYALKNHAHDDYALKGHTHEELEGGVIITPLEFLRLSGGQYVSDDQIKGLTSGGSATSGSAHGLDIPWAWFENNYPDIIGWVDDGGAAKYGNSAARLTVNKGGNRPGLTVMGTYALSYADVVIPGFVIRVDKIEEPQWGHKWPEKE